MYSYNVITNQESYPREVYYSQAKRIEELENYIMDENFNPYQDSWTDVKKWKNWELQKNKKHCFVCRNLKKWSKLDFENEVDR